MASPPPPPHRSTQPGMALIVVLWMLAALSLFAASQLSQLSIPQTSTLFPFNLQNLVIEGQKH